MRDPAAPSARDVHDQRRTASETREAASHSAIADLHIRMRAADAHALQRALDRITAVTQQAGLFADPAVDSAPSPDDWAREALDTHAAAGVVQVRCSFASAAVPADPDALDRAADEPPGPPEHLRWTSTPCDEADNAPGADTLDAWLFESCAPPGTGSAQGPAEMLESLIDFPSEARRGIEPEHAVDETGDAGLVFFDQPAVTSAPTSHVVLPGGDPRPRATPPHVAALAAVADSPRWSAVSAAIERQASRAGRLDRRLLGGFALLAAAVVAIAFAWRGEVTQPPMRTDVAPGVQAGPTALAQDASSQPSTAATPIPDETISPPAGAAEARMPAPTPPVRPPAQALLPQAPPARASNARAVTPAPRPGPSARRAASVPAFVGVLEVTSAPSGAAVAVNNKPVGTTPVLLRDFPAGTHAVRVDLTGFERWSRAVLVSTGQRARVTASLRKQAVSPEPGVPR